MSYILFVLIGIVAGVCSGIFGIGGGVVLVPMLVYIMRFQQSAANGTSLVALLLPVGGLGAYEYYKEGKIQQSHFVWGLLIASGLFVGGFFGAKIAGILSETTLRRSFAVLLFFVSMRMFFQTT